MSFDDGAADRQSHPHAVVFSGIERLKKAVDLPRLETSTRILDSEQTPTHTHACFATALNYQDTGGFLDCVHGIHSVHHQVEQYLLELHTIAQYGWQVLRQIGPDRDTAGSQ